MHCVKCKIMYKRAEYQIIKNRLEEPRKFIQVDGLDEVILSLY